MPELYVWTTKGRFTHTMLLTMPFPCHDAATTLPFSDSAVSFVKVPYLVHEILLSPSRNYLLVNCYHNLCALNYTSTHVILTPLKKTQFITMFFFFFLIIFYGTGLYSFFDEQTRLCLGVFNYFEVDREIYRKLITISKQYSTTLHVWVSDYFTHSIICRSLFITLCYVTLRMS
jgi:hypothetical protein